MTIVLAGTFAGRGGIETHFYWLSRALLEAGHRVRIASLGPALSGEDQERANHLGAHGDFRIFCPRTGPSGSRNTTLTTALNLIRELRALSPEVYLACGTGWNLFLPAILSGACGRRVFHEVMSGQSSGRWDSRRAVRLGFHEVVAQASPVALKFRRDFGWRGEVPVLPAFPEPLEITARLPTARAHSIPSGKIRAAFFSRLVPHKNPLWLVQQWPKLADWLAELHIYGTGPDEQPIRDLIQAGGWQKRVFCHGRYPDGQAYADLLATVDLTLLPTLGAEGAPLVLLESMACGVPFVAYGVGGIPDYSNADCEIADPTSPGAFLRGIQRISERLAAGTLDRARLQNFYLETFSYRQLKSKWLGYLESSGGAN